ncbi:YlbF family regulator [Paenibacillus sp. J2TS4]|uniref:YlbF family regulator n=1 Tax=Paenibacillus sp. J2TS4 TaxID=2807194 RepID=UPI001B28B4AE|nr:YlbF family regulator [Paenibacillus sp. J2TS4]GIP33153.1 hypothetical protein J2TS4_23630 [Paenibacillus sp. J2TS4]
MSTKARILKNGMYQFDTKDLIIRDDIMEKAKELAGLISTSTEVQYYRKAEMQIRNNDHVQGLIKQIKKKQKEAVAFEKTFRNPDMVKKIEEEIETLQNELDQIPIVSEFQQSQHDINYLLQLVMGIVKDTVSEKIELDQAKVEDPENCSD